MSSSDSLLKEHSPTTKENVCQSSTTTGESVPTVSIDTGESFPVVTITTEENVPRVTIVAEENVPAVVVLHFEDNEQMSIVTLHAIVLATHYGKKKVHREWLMKQLEISVKHFKLDNNVLHALTESLPAYSECNSFKDVQSISDALVNDLKCGDGGKRNLADIVKEIIAFSISKGSYDARSRSTIKFIADLFHLPKKDIDDGELCFASILQSLLKAEQDKDNYHDASATKRKIKRGIIIALATLGGGAVLALSAGLAAPLIGAGAVAVLGSGSAVVFTGATGVAVITSIFGAAGAGLAGVKMNHRVGTLEQFEFGILGEKKKDLSVSIAISGWLTEDGNIAFASSWKGLHLCEEQYCLCWDGRFLRGFGSSISTFIKKQAFSMGVKEALKRTALSGVLSAISWPLALIKAANVIDNPWSVCLQRAKEAGLQLAKVLLEKHQGHRPTTLIGYSHGARVIYCCLEELAKHKGGVGLIEDVVFLGLPVGVIPSVWETFDDVVAGSIVNCYCRTDWLLKFVYRTASVQIGDIAGLAPVENVRVDRLINVDVSSIISGHMEYDDPKKIREILLLIGFKAKDFDGCKSEVDRIVLGKNSRIRNMLHIESIKQRMNQLRIFKDNDSLQDGLKAGSSKKQ